MGSEKLFHLPWDGQDEMPTFYYNRKQGIARSNLKILQMGWRLPLSKKLSGQGQYSLIHISIKPASSTCDQAFACEGTSAMYDIFSALSTQTTGFNQEMGTSIPIFALSTKTHQGGKGWTSHFPACRHCVLCGITSSLNMKPTLDLPGVIISRASCS